MGSLFINQHAQETGYSERQTEPDTEKLFAQKSPSSVKDGSAVKIASIVPLSSRPTWLPACSR